MNKKNLIGIGGLLLGTAMALHSSEVNFPKLTGPYLGQKPPGLTPIIFAPGIVSLPEFIDFKGAFSPDGQEYYFYRHTLPEIIPTLLFTRIENGKWTEPAPLPIPGREISVLFGRWRHLVGLFQGHRSSEAEMRALVRTGPLGGRRCR